MKYTYSLIILNWKRPHNVIQIIKKLHNHQSITEIIISNGHPNSILTFSEFNKVKSINDIVNNEYYGLDLRFLRGSQAINNKLIIMDDDILIDHDNLTKMLLYYEENPNIIVGIEGRDMEHERHYGKTLWKSEKCDIVLTRLLVCDKVLCELFFKCKPLVENIYREGIPYGNGEDICLSFIAKIFYNINHHSIICSVYTIDLPNHHSIHSNNMHIPYRKKLCEYLKLNKELFNNIIHLESKSYLTRNTKSIQQTIEPLNPPKPVNHYTNKLKIQPPKPVNDNNIPSSNLQKETDLESKIYLTRNTKSIQQTIEPLNPPKPVNHYTNKLKIQPPKPVNDNNVPSSNLQKETHLKYVKVGNMYIKRKK
jgi:hypothetical protein